MYGLVLLFLDRAMKHFKTLPNVAAILLMVDEENKKLLCCCQVPEVSLE